MNPALLTALAGFGVGQAGQGFVSREAIRTKPATTSAGDNLEKIYGGFQEHLKASNADEPTVELATRVPDDNFKSKKMAWQNPDHFISSSLLDNGDYRVTMNPNADVSMLAHEMGHVAAQQTPVGEFISKTRHTPALRNAISKAALLTIPAGALATLVPGDNDIDEAVALSALVSVPAIADEFNATLRGLDIMKRADLQATAPQRAKLAGGLVSYLAAPVMMGATAALVGNQMDRPAGEQGELPM
jgi:hypothetical protein